MFFSSVLIGVLENVLDDRNEGRLLKIKSQKGDDFVCVRLWGKSLEKFKAIDPAPAPGDVVMVNAVVRSREYQGKYFTDVNALNVAVCEKQPF